MLSTLEGLQQVALTTLHCTPLPCFLPLQVLEMAFAGNCGVSVDLPAGDAMAALFAEELGLVLEVAAEDEAAVLAAYSAAGVPCSAIGSTQAGEAVSIAVGGQQQVAGTTPALRDVWEATSFQLERLQCAEENVDAEQAGLAARRAPQWRVPFTPAWTPADKLAASGEACACDPTPPAFRLLALLCPLHLLIAAQPLASFYSVCLNLLTNPPTPLQTRSGWPSSARRAATATARWPRRCTRRAWSPGMCT